MGTRIEYTEADIPKDLAADAIAVQSACNMIAIVHSLERTIAKIRAHANNKGTDWVNQHPVVRLFVHQMAYLSCGTLVEDGPRTYSEDYDLCQKASESAAVVAR